MNNIPYIAHESEVARLERVIKRLWILCIIMFTAFVISNGVWVYYNSQFEDISTTISAEQEGSGVNIVSNGSVEYEPESNDNH